MRCCTPEVVTVDVSGFFGTILAPWSVIQVDKFEREPPAVGWDAFVWNTSWIGAHSALLELDLSDGKCHFDSKPPEFFSPSGIFMPTADVIWSKSAFPPQVPICNQTPESPCHCIYEPGQGVFGEAWSASGWQPDPAWAGACEDVMCVMPPEDWRYGPINPARGSTIYEEDVNGDPAWVCHRIDAGLRPELKARVIRSTSAPATALEASLEFDVYCRREWGFPFPDCDPPAVIRRLVCGTKLVPDEDEPEGKWYCVDYRCGPRIFGPDEDPSVNTNCEQYQCTAGNNFVWPHLKAYSDSDNDSAKIELELTPQKYFGDSANKPVSWGVTAARPKDGRRGSGYEVGDTFTVNFDEAWMPPKKRLYGQDIDLFPGQDKDCGGDIQWEDDLGTEAIEVPMEPEGTGFITIQRLRVSEVDENGAIQSLEVMPWYREPEYTDESCSATITDKSKKTKYYTPYRRVICHPNSVDIAGEGYSVGDRIEWYCTDPACVTHEPAEAFVTDVDDNGGVLDWHIKGSDICMYGHGGYLCQYDAPCDQDLSNIARPDCADDGYPCGEDKRGSYKFVGKNLCSLHWFGIGNPVRAAATIYQNLDEVERQANKSTYTQCNISIIGSPCRTTLEVYVFGYKYESPGFLAGLDNEDPLAIRDQLLYEFPPYPKCNGGGAVITATFGYDPNPNAIGGPIETAVVTEPGGGFAFRDKSHVPPVLPKEVPAIEDGEGAEIMTFSFSSVPNYPAVGYAVGESHVPSPSRFAYFPVESATINPDKRGTGYVVGQEFEVKPEGGDVYTYAWGRGGGDDPDSYPNGCWYGGQNSMALTEAGHRSTPFWVDGEPPEWGTENRESICKLVISEVNDEGGIVSLDVVHGGMMYRTVWAGGVRHPDVIPIVLTSLPEAAGGAFEITIVTNPSLVTFGQVSGVTVTSKGSGYADPPGGLMWELQNIPVGFEVFDPAATLMGKIVWKKDGQGWKYSPDTEDWLLIKGVEPPVVRRDTTFVLGECYHSLLNASYPLYRSWVMPERLDDGSFAGAGIGATSAYIESWPPDGKYALYRLASAVLQEDGFYPSNAYKIIEWGQTITLAAEVPSPCPDHTDGRTSQF